MKAQHWLLALLAAFALSCQPKPSDEGTESAAAPETAAAEPATEPKAPEPAEIAAGSLFDGKEVKYMEAAFSSYEEGDYFHVTVTLDNGEAQSLFLLRGDIAVDFDSLQPGERLRIWWVTGTEYLESAGGEFEIDQVIKAEAMP
jgi:hypothetical protein